MIAGVLFDLDATLLDDEWARDLAIESFYNNCSLRNDTSLEEFSVC